MCLKEEGKNSEEIAEYIRLLLSEDQIKHNLQIISEKYLLLISGSYELENKDCTELAQTCDALALQMLQVKINPNKKRDAVLAEVRSSFDKSQERLDADGSDIEHHDEERLYCIEEQIKLLVRILGCHVFYFLRDFVDPNQDALLAGGFFDWSSGLVAQIDSEHYHYRSDLKNTFLLMLLIQKYKELVDKQKKCPTTEASALMSKSHRATTDV